MDGSGFHVEPDLLDRVAQGMATVVADQDGTELGGLGGPVERYGDPGVQEAFTEFCQAWTIGVDALCDRARWMGTSLADAARSYREADVRTARSLAGDPAMDAVEPAVPLR